MSYLTPDELIEMAVFYKERKDDYDGLIGKIGGSINYPTLFNLMKYEYLIKHLYHQKMTPVKLFHRMKDAIQEMNFKNVLIYIKELELYFLHSSFDISRQVILMISKLSEEECGYFNPNMFTFYQIIPTDKSHKFSFLVKGTDDNINKTKEYCEKLFNSIITAHIFDSWTRIVVHSQVSNYEQSVSLVNMIYDSMRDTIANKSLSDLDIRPLQKNIIGDNSFMMINLDMPLGYIPSPKPGAEAFETEVKGNYYLIMRDRSLTCDYYETNNIITLDPIVSAKLWISSNLPPTNTSSLEYYNKYKANHPVHIPVASFNELMYPHGYTLKRKVWIK